MNLKKYKGKNIKIIMKFIEYLFSNESLNSVVNGLSIGGEDTVLVCGGWGDQGFAILERAKRDKMVEKNPGQVDFIRKRIELLRKGDYNGFLSDCPIDKRECDFYIEAGYFPNYRNHRNLYFRKKNRLKTIRSKLSCLEVVEGDIFQNRNSRFSKIHLSNVLGYRQEDGIEEENRQRLLFLSHMLNLGGLVYVSNSDILKNVDIFSFLTYDDQMSWVAHRLNLADKCFSLWKPAVLVKMTDRIVA